VLSASFASALGVELPTPRAVLFLDECVFGGGGGGGGGEFRRGDQRRPRRDRPVGEVRFVMSIDPKVLLEVAPHYYQRG